MTVNMYRPTAEITEISWPLRGQTHERCRVRHAVHSLAELLTDNSDKILTERLREAERAAIVAELRIAELENRLETMRRGSAQLSALNAKITFGDASGRGDRS